MQSHKSHQPTIICWRRVGNAGAALQKQSWGGRGTCEAAVDGAGLLLLGCLCSGEGELGRLSSVTQMASRCGGDKQEGWARVSHVFAKQRLERGYGEAHKALQKTQGAQ